ncbi:serine hydroxymethyltransferase, partial [Proteus terrae]
TTHKTLAGPRGGLILAKGGDEEFYKKLNSAVFPGSQGGPLMQDITGKDADAALGRANITVNKNSVPNDPRSPFVTSGVRIGSPA